MVSFHILCNLISCYSSSLRSVYSYSLDQFVSLLFFSIDSSCSLVDCQNSIPLTFCNNLLLLRHIEDSFERHEIHEPKTSEGDVLGDEEKSSENIVFGSPLAVLHTQRKEKGYYTLAYRCQVIPSDA